MPRCLIIAGPNGAGKTTFAMRYLRRAGIDKFINADLIASGLSPFAPEEEALAAGRLFLAEIEACISGKRDFAFETTLSGRGYLKLIDRLRKDGWTTELVYVALPSVEMSKLRVLERVAHGGHNIPPADIERRFPRSLRNLLKDYTIAVDDCSCFMNRTGAMESVFEARNGEIVVHDDDLYDLLLRLANP